MKDNLYSNYYRKIKKNTSLKYDKFNIGYEIMITP